MEKVCIVGYGAIGPIHAAAIEKTENAKLWAVCDKAQEKLDICKEKYDVAVWSDFDEMLLDEEIDSVHICTPHYLHFEMIEKAVKAGKKVVCEKPAVMIRQELLKLKNLEGAEKVCFVLQNRLNRSVIKLKEIAESKSLGEITGIKGVLTWYRDKEYYTFSDWKGRKLTEGGGVLINQSVHVLDLMCYLAGNIKSVKANATNYSLSEYIEVEDTFSSYFEFENDVTGVFFATNAHKANDDFQIGISFENGTADYVFGKLFVNGEEVCENDRNSEGEKYWGSGHECLISNFYDKNIFFGLSDIENTHDTMFAMYESAKCNGKEIVL